MFSVTHTECNVHCQNTNEVKYLVNKESQSAYRDKSQYATTENITASDSRAAIKIIGENAVTAPLVH